MSEESLVEPQVEEETKESGDLPPTQSAPTEPQTPTEKPEYIPKKFWDNGKVQTEDLAKSYTELESKIGQKKEGFKDEFISEFKAEQMKDRPADEDSYTLPEIEGFAQEEILANPMLDWWKKVSFEQGFSDEQFHDGIKQFAESTVVEQDLEAEKQKLGDNADARIGSVSNWAAKNFKDGELDIVVQLGTTADGIRFLERVIGMGVSSVNSADSVDKGTGKLTLADLRSKMQDPRYWDQNQRDESFVREVEQDFQKLGGH
jgi:hypothetical protein